MGFNFLPYDDQQMFLLPPSLDEWVPEGGLARFVSDTVEHLERAGKLAAFYQRYRRDGWGRGAYHPRMMVKVLLYAYCHGVTSSRKVAQALENDVSFRFLSANQQPDFRTVAGFRREHLGALEGLFVEVLVLCREAGLAKMGRVALDGRRVQSNASLSKNRDRKGLEAAAKKILAEAERVDKEEDRLLGAQVRGDELPKELRTSQGRLSRLLEAQKRLDQIESEARAKQERKIDKRREEEEATGKKKRGRKPKKPEEIKVKAHKVNLTDLDSRIMKTRKGWVQGYNGQAVADCASQVIVGQGVTQEENDVGQLGPLLDRCVEQAGCKPVEVLADAGYWSDANAGLADQATELFIATTKDWKQRKALSDNGAPRGRIPKSATTKDRMERKLITKRGRAAYRQRGATIEPVFGQMVMRGLTRFVLRGLTKVRGEWSLWCTSHNLLKLWRSGFTVGYVA